MKAKLLAALRWLLDAAVKPALAAIVKKLVDELF